MTRCSRRTAIATLLAVVPFAGCADLLSNATGGPDPRVVEATAEQDITGAISGEVEIDVVVDNEGDTGDVEVTVTTQDDSGTTIDRFEKVVEIAADERRRVDFSVSPSEGTEQFEASAAPA